MTASRVPGAARSVAPVSRMARSVTPVSRAGNKLAGAVRAFSFDFREKTVLDIGSSTGGFTEFALKQGAKKVVAVEKGTRQMKAPLRFDLRIELHEKTDIFEFKIDDTRKKAENEEGGGENLEKDSREGGIEKNKAQSSARPDVILADVSFVSLTKVLKYAKMNLSRLTTDYLVMLKPQFEAKDEQLNRGVVKNEKVRREIVHNFEYWLRENGFLIVKKRDNDLAGKNGNVERFYWLRAVK